MTQQEMVAKFGENILKVSGLVEFLTSMVTGRVSLVTIDVCPEQNLAGFVFDKHYWSGSSGIGMNSVVGVFRCGEHCEKEFNYRDQYSASRDDWSLEFNEIKIIKITDDEVSVEVTPGREKYSSRAMCFRIANIPVASSPEVSSEDELSGSFSDEVSRAMGKCVASNSSNHPLFTVPTRICEHIIDAKNFIAAWILCEQIDVCSWTGIQLRYSVWVIRLNEEARRLFEDHAYSKERGCDIQGLRQYKDAIYFTSFDGTEQKIAL